MEPTGGLLVSSIKEKVGINREMSFASASFFQGKYSMSLLGLKPYDQDQYEPGTSCNLESKPQSLFHVFCISLEFTDIIQQI